MGQKFQHKFEEFFEFGLGDVGLGLWSGAASAPSGGPVHRHAQAHTTSSSPTLKEEEEVIVFDSKMTVDVDVDALDEDAIWQEEKLEFEDVEELGEDEAEQAQGRLEELRVQPESKRHAHYVGNSECSKRRFRQKQMKAVVGTKKLTLFFAPVANDDNNNEDDISKQ